MNLNEKKISNQHKTNLSNLKKLYNDAFYWHLIHNGYTPKRAELIVITKANNKN